MYVLSNPDNPRAIHLPKIALKRTHKLVRLKFIRGPRQGTYSATGGAVLSAAANNRTCRPAANGPPPDAADAAGRCCGG
jgi:hypothetical protein